MNETVSYALTQAGTYTIETGKLNNIGFSTVKNVTTDAITLVLPFDLGNINSMSRFFNYMGTMTQDLSTLDVSKVKNMSSAFYYTNHNATNFSQWDVSNVLDFSGMFENNKTFNGEVDWGDLKATTFKQMFSLCQEFEGRGVENWRITYDGQVNMYKFAASAGKFNADLSGWASGSQNFYNIEAMFEGCSNFEGVGLETWNMRHPIKDGKMTSFAKRTKVSNQFSDWRIPNLTNTLGLWQDASTFNSDVSNWDFSNVVNANNMFGNCSMFNSDIGTGAQGKPFTANLTNAGNMFKSCREFNGSLEGMDVYGINYAGSMFDGCTQFNQDISNWDTRQLKVVTYMFRGATSFDQDLSSWCVPSITQSGAAFDGHLGSRRKTASVENLPKWRFCTSCDSPTKWLASY